MMPLSAWYYLQFGGGVDGVGGIGDIRRTVALWMVDCAIAALHAKSCADRNLAQDLVAQVSSQAYMCVFKSMCVYVCMYVCVFMK